MSGSVSNESNAASQAQRAADEAARRAAQEAQRAQQAQKGSGSTGSTVGQPSGGDACQAKAPVDVQNAARTMAKAGEALAKSGALSEKTPIAPEVKKALSDAKATTKSEPPSSDLKRGSKGDDVKQLQKALNERGAKPPLAEDGKLGPKTEKALKEYQRQQGLTADGKFGARTREKMKADATSSTKPTDPTRPTDPTKPTNPEKPGSLRGNQKEAYDAAIKEGLSPTAARALVANMTGESLSKPNDHHWDVSHMSQGIVQWDPSRAEAIKRQFGKYPKDMSVGEQTKAAIWEMKNNPAYRQTWNALQGNDANKMMNALVRNYERPANASAEVAKRMRFYNGLNWLS